MELGQPDESGRRRPLPIEGSEFVIDLDTLIAAIGEEPDLSYLGDGHGVEVSRWGTAVVSGESLVTNVEGVFAGGDVVTGPDTVIQAMAAGKLAAEMIDKYVRGEELKRQYEFVRPSRYLPAVELTEEEIEDARRPAIPSLAVDRRAGSFAEVDQCLTEEMAVKEARRCLRCDLETEDAKAALAQQQAGGGCSCG
jgi:NADPH-dependent glutamate synthase beta subunit-like oxidoreductase